MRHRGRKSAAEREMTAFLASRSSLKVAASQPEPPPPPPYLEPPERAMWDCLNHEFVIHEGGQWILESALRVHARARHAREEADRIGFLLENHLGNRVTNPLLKDEQRFYRLYAEGMKLLKLKF
jgi:hypothetical protein